MKPMRLIGLPPTPRSGPRPNLPRQHHSHHGGHGWGHSRTGQNGRRWGRMLVWSLVVAMVGTGGMLAYRELEPLLHAWLEIRQISIHGGRQVARKEVLDRLALDRNATLLSIQPERLADRLRAHPWVKDATVTRRLPHTLDVQLIERRPAAMLQTRSHPLLLDDEGHVLAIASDAPDAKDHLLLPVLLGIDPNAVVQGDATARRTAQASVRLASVLKADSRLEVDAANPDNLVAQVKGYRFQFGSTAFEEKWDRYQRVEPDLQANASAGSRSRDPRNRETNFRSRERERPRAAEIDLRYPGKVIVRERG
jgi:cell division protein FtsQ